MLIPYQCIQKCGNVLVAASISQIDSFSLEDGSLLSTWTFPVLNGKNNGSSASGTVNGKLVNPEHESRRAMKRRRPSDKEDNRNTVDKHAGSPEISCLDVIENTCQAPSITVLKSTDDGRHMIAVTGEDKSIHVFSHNGKGELEHLSQRMMPKRPCALAIKATDSTVICADKFGDVYSLPLLLPDRSPDRSRADGTFLTHAPSSNPSRSFPAASDLTIHTARNRKALQNQMRMAQYVSGKTEPDFVLSLLLGHVSMLTDIVVVEYEGRDYIITSDRDEHIRISRGIPQTHIVEGYCLGHKEFVSRICSPITQPGILISGGGDDEIYVWDWVHSKLLHKVNLRYEVEAFMTKFKRPMDKNIMADGSEEVYQLAKITVSNIRHLESSVQSDDIVIISCEGIPALFIYSMLRDFGLAHAQTLKLDGNPLDFVVDSSTQSVIVSVDCVHQFGSTAQLRRHEDIAIMPLLVIRYRELQWVSTPLHFDCCGKKDISHRKFSEKDVGNLSSILYNLEHLRKCGEEG